MLLQDRILDKDFVQQSGYGGWFSNFNVDLPGSYAFLEPCKQTHGNDHAVTCNLWEQEPENIPVVVPDFSALFYPHFGKNSEDLLLIKLKTPPGR